ncbi:LADA_0D06568g1_1 [Lachancea dasiensis]|uniref:LADA_0D06568g1_1 n=1 Tax=Lachancea dasiensis TaxID=1072105 RepID=A0A1G4J603_9SACH|nr:LADA_0D06568g1_1 [Lachancea dasiensis]
MGLWLRRGAILGFYLIQSVSLATGLYYGKIWPVSVAPLVLGYSFTTLGIITSDFLTPSLSIISQEILHISERVAGITLLALGNSVPDITSTYQSLSSGATSLALGELVGAVVFLLTVVVGIMPLVRPIDLGHLDQDQDFDSQKSCEVRRALVYSRRRFLKDLVMFAIMIGLALFFMLDGRLMFWECFLMVAVYVGYVLYLVQQERDDVAISSTSDEEGEEEEDVSSSLALPEVDIERLSSRDQSLFLQELELHKMNLRAKIKRHLRSQYSGCMKMSLNGILNVWDNKSVFEIDPPALTLTRSLSHQELRPKISLTPFSPEESASAYHENLDSRDLIQPAIGQTFLKPQLRPNSRSISADYLLYLDNRIESSNNSVLDSSCCQDSDSETSELIQSSQQGPSTMSLDKPIIQSVMHRCWNEEDIQINFVEFLTVLLVSPVMFALKLLIPMSGHCNDRSARPFGQEYVRVFLIPLELDFLITNRLHATPILASAILTVTLWLLNRKGWHNVAVRSLSVLTFITSLATISFVVGNVVETLQRCAVLLNISEAMLGLTVFAWGNSVGDLATTVTFTKMGVLDIALGACFGGPLLIFLFGIGFDGMLVMMMYRKDRQKSIWAQSIDFEVSSLLVMSCLGLLASFSIYLLLIPLNNWHIDKKIGVVFLSLYVVVTTTNIFLEVN